VPEGATREPDPGESETRSHLLAVAERLFALKGFRNVSVREITAEAGVNLASVNYHFGSRDRLLFEIFRRRTGELSRERARRLHEAQSRASGAPQVRDILEALFGPPLRWAESGDRRISMQFIIRARSEGTEEMRQALAQDVSLLSRFAEALVAARPDLPRETAYWRLHFCLGMIHNNRFAEFDRLHALSEGVTRNSAAEDLLTHMLDFAEAGFLA
jgi:AcrR family transcriptional regulator